MKLKTQAPFQSILRVFKLKKPFFIRAFRFSKPKTSLSRKLAAGLKSLFKSPKKSKETNRLAAFRSFSETGYQRVPFPSPLTPAYAKNEEILVKEEVNEACKLFEKYLVKMIVEEGRVEHLVDVEEFLHSWNNLKCPIFMDLVCRFYGELCKDLFSNSD